MIRQYYPQRCKPTAFHGRPVGTIDVGTIAYLQDDYRRPVCRNPWIVLAWIPKDYAKCTAGRFHTVRLAGGHLARVRSLRDGRELTISDCHLLAADNAGLTR